MSTDTPLVWSSTPPTKPGSYLMSMPLGKGWHIRLVNVVQRREDLMVRAAQSNVWVPVHYFVPERQWAPCPEDLL